MQRFENKATNAESLGLDHLRSFIQVVEAGSQSRAATRLRIAQATVSRHIERVQDHFGGGLFEAGASGRLSTRGLVVEQAIRVAMTELARTRERVARDRPVLRVGFIRPMRPLVTKALRNAGKGPDAALFDVRLFEMTPEAQAGALERRELDIAVSYARPEFETRDGLETSVIAQEPFALVIPERVMVKGKPSLAALAALVYTHSPRYFSSPLVKAEQQWLKEHGLEPECMVECALGSEILAYASSGVGYGFLPALWSLTDHDGVVFAPIEFGAVARIAAYSLQHVNPWVIQLRESLSAGARTALRDFRA